MSDLTFALTNLSQGEVINLLAEDVMKAKRIGLVASLCEVLDLHRQTIAEEVQPMVALKDICFDYLKPESEKFSGVLTTFYKKKVSDTIIDELRALIRDALK